MFESNRTKIRKFLKDKDFTSLDDITQATGLSKAKTKQTLDGLKGKEIEEKENTYKLIAPQEQAQPEQHDEAEQNGGSNITPRQDISLPPLVQQEDLHKIGLNAKVDEIDRKLDLAIGVKQTKEKKAKLKKLSTGKIKRINKLKNKAVLLLGNDHSLRLVKGEYILGNISMIKIGKNYYEATTRFVWLWEGKQPVYIIPEWSIRPLCAEEVYQRAKEDNTLIDSQIINLRAVELLELEKEEGKTKSKGGNMMMYIGIAVLAIIIAWVFLGGKK